MNGIERLNFCFILNKNLSTRADSYIRSLNLQDKVDVYMEIPKGFPENQVGWALIPERKVYIRPVEEIEKFELRLVHELTHIALADEGYKLIGCYEGDTLCYNFANLLHHLVLYPRLIARGFSLEEDTNMVMNNLVENLQNYRNVSHEQGPDGTAYAVIQIMNDLVRLEQPRKKDYLLEANNYIPDLIKKAQEILSRVQKPEFSVKEYEQTKILIESELGLNDEFPWLEDI